MTLIITLTKILLMPANGDSRSDGGAKYPMQCNAIIKGEVCLGGRFSRPAKMAKSASKES
jgi:hypothetical protein